MSPLRNDVEVSESWRQRFEFFEEFGIPNSTPESRQAYRRLPLGAKFRLTSNLWAFLFGPIYFFVKGMWRKGLVLAGLAIALAVVVLGLGTPDLVDRAASLVVPALAMTTANYAYYLHAVMGSRSWNPFEGLGRR